MRGAASRGGVRSGAVRAAFAALALAAALAAGCDRSVDSRIDVTGPGFVSVPFTLTAELGEGVPTFKVDGRLRLVWDLADQPVGGHDLGVVVLPAGARSAVFDLRVPSRMGRLIVREETAGPELPHLCGATDFVDPRQTAATTVTLALCQPD